MTLTPTERAALLELLLCHASRLHREEIFLPATAENWHLAYRIYSNRYGGTGERPYQSGGHIHIHTTTLLTDWLIERLKGRSIAEMESKRAGIITETDP